MKLTKGANLEDGSFVFIPKDTTTIKDIQAILSYRNIKSSISYSGRVQVSIHEGGLALSAMKMTDLSYVYGS